jgi:hypothetical protein
MRPLQVMIVMVLFFGSVALFPANIMGQETGKQDAPLPAWKPDVQLLKQLGTEVKIEGNTIRPPSGFELKTSAKGQKTVRSWAGEPREDKTFTVFWMITTGPLPSGENVRIPTLEEELESGLPAVEKLHHDWKRTKIEHGTVNGLKCVRVYWNGTDESRDYMAHGFIYVFFDAKGFYVIGAQDIEPYSAKSIKLAETAVLTFRVQQASPSKR